MRNAVIVPFGTTAGEKTYTLREPGAKSIRAHFKTVNMGGSYNKLYIETPAGEKVQTIGTDPNDGDIRNNLSSNYAAGDTLVIHAIPSSQDAKSRGFEVDKIEVIR